MVQRQGVQSVAPPWLRDGRFEWMRHVADGGSASVHVYRDHAGGRLVAVKLLDSRILGRFSNAPERFIAEARALASLRHPNVIEVYEAGSVDGLYWYAMEFAPLGTLSMRLRREQQIAPLQATRWVFETLLGLDAVHRAGMLHRDIKPSNLLLAHDGSVRVADFGLARHPEAQVSFRTHSGSSMGSHGYAAPELMGQAKHADARADLHACAATFYHLITGRRPGALLFLHIDDTVLTGVPPEFRDLVVRGVSTDREERWDSAFEMADALTEAATRWSRRTGAGHRPRRWLKEFPGAPVRQGWLEGLVGSLLG